MKEGRDQDTQRKKERNAERNQERHIRRKEESKKGRALEQQNT